MILKTEARRRVETALARKIRDEIDKEFMKKMTNLNNDLFSNLTVEKTDPLTLKVTVTPIVPVSEALVNIDWADGALDVPYSIDEDGENPAQDDDGQLLFW